MRMIGMLIALAIVGWLVMQQLGKNTDGSSRQQAVDASAQQIEPPQVPTTVQAVPQFDHDMDSYMDAAARQRAEEMEEELQ